jgi:hypothetical protein
MANTQAPFGFTPYANNSGAAMNANVVTRLAQYNAGVIYYGDPVTSQSDGTIARSAAGTTQIAGIFIGCSYLSVSRKQQVWSNYWPGSDVASGNYVECYLITDAGTVFLAQAGGAATAIGLADIGANCNFGLGSGSTSTGLSGAYADQTTINPATTTLPFRIVGLVQDPPGANGTDITTGYNYVLLQLNNADARTLTGQ